MSGVVIGYHTFPSGKQYVYIVDSHTNTKVFLRNILILTRGDDPRTIAVVREWGAGARRAAWEPPKGQMEWKEFAAKGVRRGARLSIAQLTAHQRAGVLREMTEEAKILPAEISNLHKLPLIYRQSWNDCGLKKAEFMYQFWTAHATDEIMLEAQKRMDFLTSDADLKHMLPSDATEKDAIAWWSPHRDGWDDIRGAFSKKMTALYFDAIEKIH
jgi:hypothetical protein